MIDRRTTVRDSKSLPPLPLGVAHHRVLPGTMRPTRHFRPSVFLASLVLLLTAGTLGVITAVEGNGLLAAIAGCLAVVAVVSGLASRGWYERDQDGLVRLLFEAPLYLMMGAVALFSFGMIGVLLYTLATSSLAVLAGVAAIAVPVLFFGRHQLGLAETLRPQPRRGDTPRSRD